MTGPEPGRGPAPFHGRELEGVPEILPDELAAEAMLGRELEVLAEGSGVPPSTDFEQRVMSAVAQEPLPAPARAVGTAVRRRSIASLAASLRDAWRVTTRPGFPMAVRAQALALVLVVAGLAAGSGLATVGALGLFGGVDTTPSPRPSVQISTEPSVTGVETPEPTDGVTPAPSREPGETAQPTSTPELDTSEPAGSGDDGGDGGGSSTRTSSPTRAPSTRTPSPTETHTEDPEDGGGQSGDATFTPRPTQTAAPTATPGTDD